MSYGSKKECQIPANTLGKLEYQHLGLFCVYCARLPILNTYTCINFIKKSTLPSVFVHTILAVPHSPFLLYNYYKLLLVCYANYRSSTHHIQIP